MGGDFVIPGLVELHTDHLEGHYAPRPKVRWNPIAAVLAHDAQVATAGITTVFDALRVGMDEDADMTVDGHAQARRCDRGRRAARTGCAPITSSICAARSRRRIASKASPISTSDERVRLASLMDHAPGQRQFVNLETYAYYYQRKLKLSELEFKEFCDRRIGESVRNSPANRVAISAACHAARHRAGQP